MRGGVQSNTMAQMVRAVRAILAMDPVTGEQRGGKRAVGREEAEGQWRAVGSRGQIEDEEDALEVG